jgi:hypothetical protein
MKIIITENGLTFYHGGLDPNATISDIDVFKLSSKQQKKGREYAGFYMSPDMDENSFAIQYYSSLKWIIEILMTSLSLVSFLNILKKRI